ncbi:RND family efflux transporter MFP subunit [Symbiobacterium terraclitae]|uniref:RND family efflux transporter MFP subunit n=1 Tax=Symbiobacterium terraclitae TaxID=557451 RepID=A0ABS4JY58_9FIRM|nr:efflux RND transporter periplasmic adaptor subunit [Symbiobacterium terraclitae]MBP2019384.1 RND family efflux transporter MFP subunit [Symbiobacterium terraclitae]
MRRFFPAALLPLFALLLSACGLASGQMDEPAVEAVAVAVTEARGGTLTATSHASGQLKPILSITVTAKVPGRVVAVHRQMGDAVQEGDLLVELDDKDLANQLAAAQAQYTQAEAQRSEAARQASRLEALLAQGAVSHQQAEQIRTQLTLATAAVEAARAQLELAKSSYEGARITAPADGVLAARYVEPGALIGAGTPVFQLVDLSTVVVDTGVAEAAINSVRPGVAVPVTVPALGETFTGEVESVSPQMDAQTRSYKVRVLLPNPDGALKGGMFAEVEFPLEEREGVLIPVNALLEGSGEPYVYVVEDGVARRVTVSVAVRSDQQVLVEGIAEGDQVVVAGQNRLYDGAPVRVGGGPDR